MDPDAVSVPVPAKEILWDRKEEGHVYYGEKHSERLSQ